MKRKVTRHRTFHIEGIAVHLEAYGEYMGTSQVHYSKTYIGPDVPTIAGMWFEATTAIDGNLFVLNAWLSIMIDSPMPNDPKYPGTAVSSIQSNTINLDVPEKYRFDFVQTIKS